jgi:hypothetical protein
MAYSVEGVLHDPDPILDCLAQQSLFVLEMWILTVTVQKRFDRRATNLDSHNPS